MQQTKIPTYVTNPAFSLQSSVENDARLGKMTTTRKSNSLPSLDARRCITLAQGSDTAVNERTFEEQMKSHMRSLYILGVIEITLGAVSLVLGIAATLNSRTSATEKSPALSIADGVWCTFVTIAAGTFGISCNKTESNKCQIAFNLGFSLVAAVFSATGILLVMEVMFIWLNNDSHHVSVGVLIAFEVSTFICMTLHIVSAAICCCNMQEMDKEAIEPFLLHDGKAGPSDSLAQISFQRAGGVVVTHRVSFTQIPPGTTSNTSFAETGGGLEHQATPSSHRGLEQQASITSQHRIPVNNLSPRLSSGGALSQQRALANNVTPRLSSSARSLPRQDRL